MWDIQEVEAQAASAAVQEAAAHSWGCAGPWLAAVVYPGGRVLHAGSR